MNSPCKFFISTFGCRCNQADSSEMRARLCAGELEETKSPEDADLIVVNSCTVTRRADQQVRQAVRRYHRENPDARLVVTGCYAERDPETIAGIPGVSKVLGNADRKRLADVWHADTAAGEKIIRSPLGADRDFLMTGAARWGGKTRPFIKLQDGCDARCSYCIVPAVRGASRSAAPEEILAGIRSLVERGYQEIVLTGVNLGTYGRRLKPPVRLADVLARVLEIPGLGRLRLSSVEPMSFDLSIIELAAAHRNFAPHFHIPLQSGSGRTLRRMRRPHTPARFLDLLEYIQSRLPAAGLGTDVLAGFPGETEEDFRETCELVRKAPLSYLHVFPFSAREGTEAFSLPDRIPPAVLDKRCEILREISQSKNLEFRRRFLGQVVPAIGLDLEEEMGEGIALTENYIHVRISDGAVASNRLIRIRIEDVQPGGTRGSVIGCEPSPAT
jgi:threonylcarbamoyladenosine tRNA methylthiotransferase MtaB